MYYKEHAASCYRREVRAKHRPGHWSGMQSLPIPLYTSLPALKAPFHNLLWTKKQTIIPNRQNYGKASMFIQSVYVARLISSMYVLVR